MSSVALSNIALPHDIVPPYTMTVNLEAIKYRAGGQRSQVVSWRPGPPSKLALWKCLLGLTQILARTLAMVMESVVNVLLTGLWYSLCTSDAHTYGMYCWW
jgi:hypothetical protein